MNCQFDEIPSRTAGRAFIYKSKSQFTGTVKFCAIINANEKLQKETNTGESSRKCKMVQFNTRSY